MVQSGKYRARGPVQASTGSTIVMMAVMYLYI
jgi:hypothetical protein